MDVVGTADAVVVVDKVAAVADLFVDVVAAAVDVADQLSCSIDHYYSYCHYYRDVPHSLVLLLHSPIMLNIMIASLLGYVRRRMNRVVLNRHNTSQPFKGEIRNVRHKKFRKLIIEVLVLLISLQQK